MRHDRSRLCLIVALTVLSSWSRSLAASIDSHFEYPGEKGLLSMEGVYGVSAPRPVAPLALKIPFDDFTAVSTSYTNGLLWFAGSVA